MRKIVYCADVIARFGNPHGPIVLIRRLGTQKGLALPGGKQEKGESLSLAVCREFHEETGMSLSISSVLGTYAEDGRDERGRYVSTVFIGVASGLVRAEKDKTEVFLLQDSEVINCKDDFVFDHFQILLDYFTVKKMFL